MGWIFIAAVLSVSLGLFFLLSAVHEPTRSELSVQYCQSILDLRIHELQSALNTTGAQQEESLNSAEAARQLWDLEGCR